MPDIFDCLKEDLGEFENKITDLNGQRAALAKQIDDIETNIKDIEPLRTYAESLLKRVESKPAPSKKASSKTGASRPLA